LLLARDHLSLCTGGTPTTSRVLAVLCYLQS